MKTIAVISRKGGVGKSTLCINLAVAAARDSQPVTLVDTDQQGTCEMWFNRRTPDTVQFLRADADQLPQALAMISEGLAIIDCPPSVVEGVMPAIKAADLVLIPCRPSLVDLHAIGRTAELITSLYKKGGIVLNQCPVGRGEREQSFTKECRSALAAYGIPVAPISLATRVGYQYSIINGQGIVEYEPDGKGSRELVELWQWVKLQL